MSGRNLAGRVALVTGAASGIGAATTHLLRDRGATVIAVDREAGGLAHVAEAGPGVETAVIDVTQAGQLEALVESVVNEHGVLHIAVNCAGVNAGDSGARLHELSSSDWHATLGVNLDGIFYSLRAELGGMIRCGTTGTIVNVASIMGIVATRGAGAYVASKHGVVGLTRAAALEYGREGIRINAVAPGFVDTPMVSGRTHERMTEVRAAHPLNRIATASEVAEVIGFLASDAAAFVSGAVYTVDGGYTVQ